MFVNLQKYGRYAPTVVRIVVGVLFLLHGLAKFGAIGGGSVEETIAMFEAMNMPVPAFTAIFVAVLETVGGLALILGFGTWIAAAALSVVLLVAILAVKLPAEANPVAAGGYEVELALLAGLVVLIPQGAGAFSLQGFLNAPGESEDLDAYGPSTVPNTR
ncbi:MAG: DoxX family protein [Caldilineaceae bacterium]|nr:DoxX family protein [Caldilineaceae bacterium]